MQITILIVLLIVAMLQASLFALLLRARHDYDELAREYTELRTDCEVMMLNLFVVRGMIPWMKIDEDTERG